jgi:tRNA(Ile)-lysidine synthase
MLDKFNAFIIANQLCQKDDRLLLTVSGGLDSVVMAHLFRNFGYHFAIAHCNFGLRGKESDDDEVFVKKLASETFKTDFYTVRFDTLAYAKEHKLSIQQAARELRYTWFEKIRSENKLKSIATAHHADDQLETFFINLIRGTGISGLSGIPLKQNHIIRPMLFASRLEIEAYAKQNGYKFRNDSSNQSDKYLRNKIRLKLFPLLEVINPVFRDTISQSIQNLKSTEIIYKEQIQKLNLKKSNDKGEVRIEINRLKALKPGPHYLFELISEFGFNRSVCNDIFKSLDGISGKQFYSPSHAIIRDREHLIVYPNQIIMDQTSEYLIVSGATEISFPYHMKFSELKNTGEIELNNGSDVAMVDWDRLTFPLVIRKWEEGDFFYPLGMKTKKKLSDFFIDNKLSLKEKSDVWLLCSCKEIVWVIGYRIDERYKVRPRTDNIFVIKKF